MWKMNVCVCVCKTDHLNELNSISYSFPLLTPPLWAGIWFSQVLLNWLLRFESESDNIYTHTHTHTIYVCVRACVCFLSFCRYEQGYLSPSCSHLSWWPRGCCPCLWSPSAVMEPLCNQHSSLLSSLLWTLLCVCVRVCVCTLAELTMSPVGNFKEWTLQRPIKAAKRTQRVNIWLIPQHSRWELTHTHAYTHKFKLIISIPWHAAWKKTLGLRKTKASETNSQLIDG